MGSQGGTPRELLLGRRLPTHTAAKTDIYLPTC